MTTKYRSEAYPVIARFLKANQQFFTHEFDEAIKEMGKEVNVYRNSEVWHRMFRYFKRHDEIMLKYGIRSIAKIKVPEKKEYLWKIYYTNE